MLLDLTLPLAASGKEITAGDENVRLLSTGHVGTHLDSYVGTAIPLDYFRSRGVALDVRGIEARDIGVEDIEPDAVQPGDFVLFHTGWIERYDYGTKDYAMEHPQLSDALIDLLLDKGVHFIGLDAPGIRRHAEHRPADVRCEEAGAYVIENLRGLKGLPQGPFTVYTLWLAVPGASGLPCRVLAEW